jgi:hypothetical protein
MPQPDGRSQAERRLREAQAEYEHARAEDYVAREIRDTAMVEAHRAGLSSREIGSLVGGLDQPNVVRARRRAIMRREVMPDGLLSPTEALRLSSLSATEFITAVRTGRIRSVEVYRGVYAFRPEEVRALSTTAT